MRRVAVAVAVAIATAGCGPSAPAPSTTHAGPVDRGPVWADVFEGTPDLYAVVRPRALQRDGVYGTFWQALMRAAEARGLARGSSMIEAADGAEEIVAGLGRGADAALVLRGISASLDPGEIRDSAGQRLFRLLDEHAKVPEYELLDRGTGGGGAEGALFVLPDRVWVGALGDARARARRVFAVPLHRPEPKVDPTALLSVRVAGPLAHALDRHELWGPLERRLTTATFNLMPAKGGLVVQLVYSDADGAAWAEQHAKALLAELAKEEKRFGWLKDATVRDEGSTLTVRVAVPPRLLLELPAVTGADLGL